MPPSEYTGLVPVTGEAVALDLRLAQFPSRTLALALDLVLQLVLLVVIGVLAANTEGLVDGAAATAIALLAVVSVLVGLPTLVETLTRGRSLGKIAAGLRVVRDDGGPVRFRHSFVRALFMLVDFWLTSGAVGLISSLLSSRAKRLGDHFAGTVVIRERVTSAAAIPTHSYAMPPGLQGWASRLDLSRLPDVTALQARQLLGRAGTLDPAVRTALATRLAAEMSSYVTPAAPPGVPPETYLAAVLTERMRRASAATWRSTGTRQPAQAVITTPPEPPPYRSAPEPMRSETSSDAPRGHAGADPDGFALPG
jgi:uncharacterized RDD family membrane protein YckC